MTKNFKNYYKNINLHIQKPLQTLSGRNAEMHKQKHSKKVLKDKHKDLESSKQNSISGKAIFQK